MRLIAFIEYAAVVTGIIAILAGQYFALPKAVHLGVFLVGAGFALAGLEAFSTRRMGFRASEDAWEAYAGVPALIVGAMALLVGASFIAAGYAMSEGLWHTTVNYLERRPAPVLAAAGALLAGTGLLMMLNPQGRRGIAWTLLVRIPRWLLGLVVLAAGLAGIALGAWEWLEPKAFDSFAARLPRKLEWPF